MVFCRTGGSAIRLSKRSFEVEEGLKKQQPYPGLDSPLVGLAPIGVLRLNGYPRAISSNVGSRAQKSRYKAQGVKNALLYCGKILK